MMKYGIKLKILLEKILVLNKFVKIKIKAYKNKIETGFHDEELVPEKAPCIGCSMTLANSVY